MHYILKHFNKNILEFTFKTHPLNGTNVEIVKKFKENETFLPLALKYKNLSLLE